jgi:hypothetical protein
MTKERTSRLRHLTPAQPCRNFRGKRGIEMPISQRVVDVLPVLYLAGFFFAVRSQKIQWLGDIARTIVISIR